jgi:hypothetical protein
MCEQCVQTWKDLYPQLKKWPGWEDLTENDDRVPSILSSYTGYPIVTPEMIREQLQYLCDHGPEATKNHIYEELDRGMEEARAWRDRQEILHRRWIKGKDGDYCRCRYH